MGDSLRWQNFKRQRLGLTFLWLVMLAVNIGLQFESVENWLEPKVSGRFVAAQWECSSLQNFKTPNQEQQVTLYFVSALGLSSSSKRLTSVLVSDSSFVIEMSGFGFSQFKYLWSFTRIDLSLVSGLSPPLFL